MHKKTILDFIKKKPLVTMAIVAFSILTVSATYATDYQLVLQIDYPVADVCQNIDGPQAVVPDGMLTDTSGNCYTPTSPPSPSEPIDLCINITGLQANLPDGYYRTTNGSCYLQPAAPSTAIDVCANIDDVQTVVPDGHYLDTSNNCVPAPVETDVCSNIPGSQAIVPQDMQVDNGKCYTPAAAVVTDGPTTTEKIRNVPDALQPAAKALVNALPKKTVTFFKNLPSTTVQQIPVYVFIMIFAIILVPLLQSIREVIYVRQLAVILKRERSIAEQKDNFIALASHYLRTPMTVMRNGVDMMIAMEETAKETVDGLVTTLADLDAKIASVLHDLEQNTQLHSIQAPPEDKKIPSILRSSFFWFPIGTSIVITLIANFFIGVVGNKTIPYTNTIFQTLLIGAFVIAMYLLVRNYFLQKRLYVRHQQLIEHEKTVDETRNSLIASQTTILKEGLDAIDEKRGDIARLPSYHFFEDGYSRFSNILEKFLLLSQIQAGAQRTTEEVSLRDAVNQVIFSYQSALAEKDITVTNAASDMLIKQNPLLFNFVLSSLIDNAIKFNKEGGKIVISDDVTGRKLSISIADNGIGIDNNKLDQLFKPFSRATSAVEFNYEGLGFSLFLNKLIMEYTGGAIEAQPDPVGGTRMVVETPLASSV